MLFIKHKNGSRKIYSHPNFTMFFIYSYSVNYESCANCGYCVNYASYGYCVNCDWRVI